MKWPERWLEHYQKTHVIDLILHRDVKKMEKHRDGELNLIYWTQDEKQWIRKIRWWHYDGYLCWKWIGIRKPSTQRDISNNTLHCVYMTDKNCLGLVKRYRITCNRFTDSVLYWI